MSDETIDLRGNTNFVVLKDLNDAIVVPRTNLAAVDMTVANGLAINGNTLYASLATAEDIETGTIGSLVDAAVLKSQLDSLQTEVVAGTGITITSGSTISTPIATVSAVLNGAANVEHVDVIALRGALTTGQAVDVTSEPDQTITGDYKGEFTTTATTLGFAAFPKFAKNLKYLLIADITVDAARTVTPSGTWLDGSTTAKSLAANESTSIAMLFTSSDETCAATLTFSGSGTITVINMREYEVTACTPESVAYIAALSNPDAFADYYLVKADMVQPWTYIIDMGTSPAVTIAAGLSYKLNASTGTHTLTVDTCPAGYDGRDAIIRITLGGNGIVQAVAPLQLGDALVPYAINNCVVKFRDGEAVLLVEDTLAGYVVTVTSGTDSGSLAYGLATTGVPYIAFSTGTDGSVVDMGNAVTANEAVTVVGNGYTNTTITGNITCTNKTTVANLGLQDVTVAGGTLTLGDAYIPSGTTVSVNGGGLAVEKVTGAGEGSVINLGGTNIKVSSGDSAYASGVSFVSGGNAQSSGGAFYFEKGTLVMSGAVITNNTARYAGGIFATMYSIVTLTNCTVSGNTVASYQNTKDMLVNNHGKITISGCTVGNCGVGTNGELVFSGLNTVESVGNFFSGNFGTVTLTSGAILDLTGNTTPTPIAPGGGITFESGGATVQLGSSSYMMDNITLPAGAKLANTAVVDLAGSNVIVSSNSTASASGCTISGGSAANGGAILVSKGGTLSATSCSFTSNTATSIGGAIFNLSGTCVISNCTFNGNNATTFGLAVLNAAGAVTIANCSFGTGQSITNTGAGAKAMVVGSCSVGGTINKNGAYGELYISAGAVIDATGNTNNTVIIQSASGCKVGTGTVDAWVVGGTATFTNSAGSSVVLEGTFTRITKAGAVS